MKKLIFKLGIAFLMLLVATNLQAISENSQDRSFVFTISTVGLVEETLPNNNSEINETNR